MRRDRMSKSPLLLDEDVPGGWKRAKLREVADISGGTTPRRSESSYWDGDLPWARPSDLTSRGPGSLEIKGTEEYMTETALEETSVSLLPPGSVLMTSRATIGEVAINTVPMATNQGFCNFVPSPSIDARFLSYWLAANSDRFERLAAGSTFTELSKSDARQVEIALPPLAEQRGIVETLSVIDDLLSTTCEIVEEATGIWQGLMRRLLSRGIGHTDFHTTPAGDIPHSWKVLRLGSLVDILTGHPFSSEHFSDDPTDGPPLVRIRNLSEGDTDLYFAGQYCEDYLLDGDDILVAMDGEFTVRRWPISGALLNQRVCKVESADPSRLAEPFLFYLLALHLPEIQRKIGGTTVKHLSVKHLRRLKVALPPRHEQQKIASVLDSVRSLIKQEKEKLQSVRTLKRGLMQDLLTGRVRTLSG